MRGVLMFAHNNELFDYGKMAYASALSAMHYIKKAPISLVTDLDTWQNLVSSYPLAEWVFGNPIFVEYEKKNYRHFDMIKGNRQKAAYHNLTRLRAYELSPYDETLLLDSDVLVQDHSLNNVWGTNHALRMNRGISNLFKNEFSEHTTEISENGLTTFWATMCYFQKSQTAKDFFGLANYIAENYEYYGLLHQFQTGIIRVDFAMTIAAHIMSGYLEESIVAPLPCEYTTFAWNKDIMIDVGKGRATFLTEADGRTLPVTTYQTVHCMNKDSMMAMADRIIETYA